MSVSQGTPARRLRTVQEAALALGVTERTLFRWKVTEWWPEDAQDGDGYDIAIIEAARPEKRRESPEGALIAELREELLQARANLQSVLAEQGELKVAARRGEVVDVIEANRLVTLALLDVAAACDLIPKEVARQLPAKIAKPLEDDLIARLNAARREAADTVQKRCDAIQKAHEAKWKDDDDEREGSTAPAADPDHDCPGEQ